jgi:hypothetical protein
MRVRIASRAPSPRSSRTAQARRDAADFGVRSATWTRIQVIAVAGEADLS